MRGLRTVVRSARGAWAGAALIALTSATLLSACSIGGATQTFREDGISVRYPEGWHVAGFSETNSPPRLAVASYPLPDDAVEGDCGGYHAAELIPPGGALVVLIDYGSAVPSLRPREPFPARRSVLTWQDGHRERYECAGDSTMFRFRVGDRDFQAHVALGPEASEAMRDRALAILESVAVTEPVRFDSRMRVDGDRVVLPVTFPDGTTAELVSPRELALERYTIRPYSSGRLSGSSPTPGRGDLVGRDFFIVDGEVSEVLARMGAGAPVLVAEHDVPGGGAVGLWDVGRRTNVHYLGFQFGRWAVLVYDYKAAGAMTDAEQALWVESFAGRETKDGWLVLEGTKPLRLARAGEHAGPELTFYAPGTERSFGLYPGTCRPHRDQERVVAGKLVSWRGGFADWCVSASMRIRASGPRRFVGALIRQLEVRRVVLES